MPIYKQVDLSPFTTIRIGGRARFFCEVKTLDELGYAIKFASDMGLDVFPLGRGANTIFGDFDGLVICLRGLKGLKISRMVDSISVEAQAGVPLSELVNLSLRENLEGFYKLVGFPATVGGAVAMNAGAYGYEISQHLIEVDFIDWEGNLQRMSKEELRFAYRSSPFPELGIVVAARFELPKAKAWVRNEYSAIKERRKSTQPINMPTSGSTFKNPTGEYAGRLLEKAGMKGFRLGGVAFSELHANFLINMGGATHHQVVELINLAKDRVFENFGIKLEEEVKLVESGGAYGRKVSRA